MEDKSSPSASGAECQIIYFGGTILMKETDQGLRPHFTPEHIGCYDKIIKSPLADKDKESLIAQLLETSPGDYAAIQKQLGDKKPAAEFRKDCLASIGYAPYKRLSFNPIDSINFDVSAHYKELFKSTVATIKEGKLPVILGGTDSLRFYGTLLAEDLKAHGINTPVVIVSSMRAFGDAEAGSQNHVLQLFKAARVAASQMQHQGKSGVFALVAEDLAVSRAELLSLNQPVDKISGSLVKAFVGKGVASVTPDDVMPNVKNPVALPAHLAHQGVVSSYKGLVLPPVESYSKPQALNAYLGAVAERTEKDIHGVIIKGLPDKISSPAADKFIQLIGAITAKGIHVQVVSDLEYNPEKDASKLTPIQPDFASHPLRARAKAAGAVCQEGISSTQSYIQAAMLPARAGMGGAQVPLDNSATSRLKMPPLALEYVPDSKAYMLGLELAKSAGIKDLVSVNFTHGTMAGSYARELEKFAGMNITVTFKYASKDMGAGQENADLDGYAAAKDLRGQHHILVGRRTSPPDLAAYSNKFATPNRGPESPPYLGR